MHVKVEAFKIGIRENDISKMLVKYPWIVSPSILENFEEIVDFFDDEKVPRISTASAIKNWPHILGCSVDKIELMVEQFRRMDIRKKKLGQVIAKSPQLLLRKPEEFDQVAFFLGEIRLVT
ncbi:mitochondrial transcription termination factorfamily protein [Striga asiatica]|uniref:Mitochondrial transcription termination factorfamily protein n=1 Tax=Striga asiatica TaxID=4170 RepID=A0A5A7P0R8_STRAF|nr:mitochondrial transcription termination factorfamily protein [Striga asiatica]